MSASNFYSGLDRELLACIRRIGPGCDLISHPLMFSGLSPDCDNSDWLNKAITERRAALARAIAERDWQSAIIQHKRPYRMQAFYELAGSMSDEEYWELLADVWTDCSTLWQHREIFAELLNSPRPGRERLMNDDDRVLLARLPARIKVYRGHGRRRRTGHSWSVSYHTARWFAWRAASHGGSVVTEGWVQKDNVIAVMTGRSEFELVIDPQDVELARAVRPPRRTQRNRQLLANVVARLPASPASHYQRPSVHGLEHWDKVELNGVELAANTPGADAEVVRLFALIHDCARENEGEDPDHGQRAAVVAGEMLDGVISDDQLALLQTACRDHESGMTTPDPTIGCCWDADRLDLLRVGIVPEPAMLSTEYGRSHIWQI